MASQEVRYKAFISYSHHDRRWAGWLHRTLEAYRPPRESGVGRLRPIFRDSAELSAGPDLGASIRAALDRSECLILVCSPAAARSWWVAAEVRHFVAARGADRVFCVIVDGANGTIAETLPAPLRDAMPAAREPLAIDLRPGRDGRRLARLKLAAGLLGVDLDALVRREARRRVRWTSGIAAASTALSLTFGALTLAAVDARRSAERQSAASENLVAFMLGDLRDRLEPVGRLELLDGVGRKVLEHYGRGDPGKLDDTALAQQAKALTLLGSIRVKRGDLPGARQAFTRAAGTSAALVARAPRDGARLFDHAQNVYWQAYVDWKLDRIDAAERGFETYAALADTLARLDPGRADWRLEPAYARSNLGTLLLERGRTLAALAAFETARAGFDAAWREAPNDKGRLTDLVDAQNWVADAQFRLGRLREAYRERARAAALLHARRARDPDNRPLEAQALAADLALARRGMDLGRLSESRDIVSRARIGLERLVRYDPANVSWLEFAIFANLDSTDIAMADGRWREASTVHDSALRQVARLRYVSASAYRWRPQIEGRAERQSLLLAGHVATERARRALARRLRDSASRGGGTKEPAEIAALIGLSHLALGETKAAIAILLAQRPALLPDGRDLLARALMQDGRIDEARAIVAQLYNSGYRHSAFLAFWKGSLVYRRNGIERGKSWLPNKSSSASTKHSTS